MIMLHGMDSGIPVTVGCSNDSSVRRVTGVGFSRIFLLPSSAQTLHSMSSSSSYSHYAGHSLFPAPDAGMHGFLWPLCFLTVAT